MEKIKNDNIQSNIMSFQKIANISYIDNMLWDAATVLDIDNIKECNINEFKAILQYAGARLFPKKSNILKIENNIFINGYNKLTNNNMYDFYKLDIICDIYIFLSHKYNKLIHLTYYGYLINISASNIHDLLNKELHNSDINILDNYVNLYNSRKLNSIRIEILKKLKEERINNYIEKCYNAGGLPLVASINHEFGWNQGGSNENNNISCLSVNELPQITDNNSNNNSD